MFFHKLSMWRWALRIPFSLPFPPLVVIYDRYLSLLNPIVPFKTKPYHIRSTQVPNPLFATGLSSLLARPSALVAPAVVCPHLTITFLIIQEPQSKEDFFLFLLLSKTCSPLKNDQACMALQYQWTTPECAR